MTKKRYIKLCSRKWFKLIMFIFFNEVILKLLEFSLESAYLKRTGVHKCKIYIHTKRISILGAMFHFLRFRDFIKTVFKTLESRQVIRPWSSGIWMNECFVHLNLHPQAVPWWAASVGAYLFSAYTALILYSFVDNRIMLELLWRWHCL